MATFADARLGPSRKTRTQQGRAANLYAITPLPLVPYGPFGQDVGSVAKRPPVQRPLARQRVVLSHQVIAYYGRIRVSRALPPIYAFIQRIFPCQSYPGPSREVPQFTLPVFPSVPSSIPRLTGKVLLTVSSLPALAFASFTMARHPNIPRHPVPRGA